MQGEVIIGTKLDKKQLEKDLKQEEKKLQQFEKDAEKLTEQKVKIEAEIDLKEADLRRKIEEITKKAEAQKIGLSTIRGTDIDRAKKIDATAQARINSLTQQYDQYLFAADEKIKNIESNLKQNAIQQGTLNKKILEMNSSLGKTNGFNGIKKSIDTIGKSLEKNIKKVTRWGLAIFGVRSAYLFIRRSVSTLSEYDEGLAQDTQYISYLLASMMKPIIETIVKLVYKLLAYINAIARGWFGIDLFASASTEEFKKQNQQAQKLSKTMAGFDEMNVLQEDGSTKGSSANLPELPEIENIPIPDWIQWIADHGKELTSIIAGITGAVIALKLGFKGLQALGIGLAIYGILEFIQDLLDFIKDPSWEGFIKVISDIGIAIGGLMLVFGNWQGLIVAGIALLVKLVIEHWDEISEVLGKVGDWIKKHVIDPIANFFTGLWEGIKNGFSNIWNFIITAFSKGGQIFNGLKDGIVNTFKAIVNTLISGINSVIKIPFDKINGLLNTIRNAKIPVINVKPFKGLWGKNPLPVPKIPKLAKGTILNNPGQGVPVAGGSARAGEAGREAYLPLSDKQLLEELGSTIGKYVTIQATIPVYAYNRQVDRQVRTIRATDEFAKNG